MENIENLKKDQLIDLKNNLIKELFEMKMKNKLGQLSSPIKIRLVRRKIARTLTVLIKK
jgi:ribosomal protein L29